jgi:biopolymer transport protein ExbB
MKVQMTFFETRKAAVPSGLTLLVLAIPLHSALCRERAVTDPARSLGPIVAQASPAPVPTAATAPAVGTQLPASDSSSVMPPPSPQVGNSAESISAANAAPARQSASGAAELPQDLSAWGMFLHADRVVKSVMTGLGLASLAT